jgi:hypothetical protein
MNIEQGMSKEEGSWLSEEMATKNAKKTQTALHADIFEHSKSVVPFVSCFFCVFSWRHPFFFRHSLFDVLRFSRR